MIVRILIAALLLASGAQAAPPPAYGPALNARIFDQVWSEVDRNYWDRQKLGPGWIAARDRYRDRALNARDARALYTVLNEMLDTVGDSHVFVVSPAQRRFDLARGGPEDAAGLGFSSALEGDEWRVFSVRPDGPAAAAGVQIGWRLMSVNGRPLDLDFHPAAGEVVTLLFRDEHGADHPVSLTAANLPQQPARRAEILPGGVLLLGIDSFGGGEDRWIDQQLRRAPAGVILDLRENEGGESIAIAKVAGRFFTSKQTMFQRIGRKGAEDVPTLGAGRNGYLGPLAVLVGPRSASGAEAIAALIEESGRGVTIGQTTSGALTGASETSLPDGGELSVAEFDVRTVRGKRIEGVGFTPRFTVNPSLADLRAGKDPAVTRALALLQEQ
jgi:carboxyl-terminal processing protease